MPNDLKTKIAEAISLIPFADEWKSDNIAEIALQAIHDAGFAVVPLVPTQDMCHAGATDSTPRTATNSLDRMYETVGLIYRAMIKAAQPKTEEG